MLIASVVVLYPGERWRAAEQSLLDSDYLPSENRLKLVAEKVSNVRHQADQRQKVVQPLSARSLSGTEIDGRLKVDENGALLIDREVRHVFEYFLSVLGEASLEDIVQAFEAHAYESLPKTAASEAVELLYDYLDTKVALADAMEGVSFSIGLLDKSESIDELSRFFDMRRQVRQVHLGQVVASAFYGDEDAYDHYQIEKARLNLNGTLNDAEKYDHLTLLENELLSPELAANMQRKRAITGLLHDVDTLRAKGASESDIFAVRQKALGQEYALRMRSLDHERQQWQARLESYKGLRDGILSSGLSTDDQQAAIDEMQNSMFSATEKLRLKAYDNGPG